MVRDQLNMTTDLEQIKLKGYANIQICNTIGFFFKEGNN